MKIKLRTLFIFVTVAILLAVFALEPYVHEQAEHRVRETLREHFSQIEFKTVGRATKELKCVGDAGGFQIVDTKTLSVLRELESLQLENCHVENRHPKKKLFMSELCLNRTKLDRKIPMPNLKKLIIRRSASEIWFIPSDDKLTPEGFDFKPFRDANSLVEVLVAGDFVTNFVGLEFLNKLSIITADRAKIYSIEGVDLLESLEHLDISSGWQRGIPVADIAALCNCKSLKSLRLPGDLPPDDVERIKTALPECKIWLKP